MSKYLKNLSSGKKQKYDDAVKRAAKNIMKDTTLRGTSIDPKRQISRKDKEIVWYQSITSPYFDETIFRCDPLGCVAIKNINSNITCETQKNFSYDYEHIVSHSANGRSIIENICILNAGINRSKGTKPLTGIDFYKSQGLVEINSIKFEQLLSNLENDLDSCRRYYDLYFYKNNQRKWSIRTGTQGKLYESYDPYSNYLPQAERIVKLENQVIAVLVPLIIVGTIVIVKEVSKHSYNGVENVINFAGPHLHNGAENAVNFVGTHLHNGTENAVKAVNIAAEHVHNGAENAVNFVGTHLHNGTENVINFFDRLIFSKPQKK
jgi:hypothetical protein